MVTARLRFLDSPDADPIEAFAPSGSFGILVTAMVGPADGPGQESFDFMLCTPDWFASHMKDDIAVGRHHVFVKQFNYAQLQTFVEDYCAKCSGKSWAEGRIIHRHQQAILDLADHQAMLGVRHALDL